LYPAGVTATSTNRLAFKFLNGSTTAPFSGQTAASFSFTLPTAPGSYDVRLFLNNSSTVLATSESVTITP
jgi:hypothetical protein